MGKLIALLRGINVAGANKVPMAELRTICEGLGWQNVETYIQSGNVVFQASGSAASSETALEKAIEAHLALSIPVIVRPADQWSALVAGNPFAEIAEAEANRVMMLLAKAKFDPDAAAALQARAADGEQVRQAGEVLWVHYPGGAGTSKLSPSLFDRLAGSRVTARNWRTVVKLKEMAGA